MQVDAIFVPEGEPQHLSPPNQGNHILSAGHHLDWLAGLVLNLSTSYIPIVPLTKADVSTLLQSWELCFFAAS